jgi:hypothetical protein
MNSTGIEKLTTYYGYTYLIPFICMFGIICNLINLSVLKNPKLRESPYTYLTGLAICDLLTLVSSFSITFTRGNWFESFQSVTIVYWLKLFERKCFLPIANIFSALSVTITVALTVERYFFIKLPMKANAYCSPKFARKIILILIFLVFMFRLPMFFFWSVTKVHKEEFVNNTTRKFELFEIKSIKNYQEFQKIYFTISFFIFEIIPFFILFFFNMKLIMLVKRANREFLRLRNNSTSVFYSPAAAAVLTIKNDSSQNDDLMELNRFNSIRINVNHQSTAYFSKRKQDELKLTRSLILLIFLALISEISSIITYDRITEFLIGRHIAYYMETAYKLQVLISNMIILTLHSMNFFVFCAFNKKYNVALRQQYSRYLTKFVCNKFQREDNQFN